MDYGLESDSVGEKQVPKDAYYGVRSLGGMENFPITGRTLYEELTYGLTIVKKACAIVNHRARIMKEDVKNAIVYACDQILKGEYHDQFLTDSIQGGAGVTANVNANEVIADIANEKLGRGLGTYEYVRPNDHVNMSQSISDVFPTAGKIATLRLLIKVLNELKQLGISLLNKSIEFDDILKTGRTRLQSAVSIRLGQEFHAYYSVTKRDIKRVKRSSDQIESINMGVTMIGAGVNVNKVYFTNIVPILAELTGFDSHQVEDLIDGTNNLDELVEISSAVKSTAVSLSKMASGLRLMSSGPKTMVGDIELPPRQNGSSIMPGKVNPVIPEVVNQAVFKIIGNDNAVTMCAEHGQLELNALEPVLFDSLFESMSILTNVVKTFGENCILGIKPNRQKLSNNVKKSVGVVTAPVPHIGYKKSAKIAKRVLNTGITVRNIVLGKKILTEDELKEILDPIAMTMPGIAAEYLIKQKQQAYIEKKK